MHANCIAHRRQHGTEATHVGVLQQEAHPTPCSRCHPFVDALPPRLMHQPFHRPLRPLSTNTCRLSRSTATAVATAAALLAGLPGCSKPEASGPAQTGFDAITTACTQYLAARQPHVRPGATGDWTLTGYSPALVQPEVSRTESTVTPYLGKLVIKDNEAQAHAPTEAAAKAITLTPAHLLSNRTHTFIYSFDGQSWRWQNGQRLTKIPGQNDRLEAVTLAEVSAAGPKGFAGCLPQ